MPIEQHVRRKHERTVIHKILDYLETAPEEFAVEDVENATGVRKDTCGRVLNAVSHAAPFYLTPPRLLWKRKDQNQRPDVRTVRSIMNGTGNIDCLKKILE